MNIGSNSKSRKRSKRTVIAAFFGFLLAVALIGGLMAPSLALGPPPAAAHRVWGDVTFGLELAPADTVVSAQIGDLEWTTLVDDQGSYGLEDPFFYVPADDLDTPEKDGGDPGDIITWWVNGVLATTTCPLCDDPAGPILFENMGHNRVDLNVSDVTYDLTVNANPFEGGIVTGSGAYPEGAVVPVTATPADECWYFINWTGDVADTDSAETTVSVDADKTVTANFAKHSCILTVNANPPEGGTVTGGGTYDCCTDVEVTATPADDRWYFVDWSGDVADHDSAETTVSVEGDKTVTANFAARTYELALVSGWNLVSLPLIPNSANTEDIIAGIIDNIACVWTYDNATGRWAFYAPGAPSDLTEMTCGKGYWVRVTDSCTLTIEGS